MSSSASGSVAPAPLARPPRTVLGAACALGGAACWGGSAPFAKLVLDRGVGALEAAGLLYVGGALGLALLLLVGRLGGHATTIVPAGRRRGDAWWIVAAAIIGGGLAPVLMMYGQTHTSGLATALLITVEPPATALIAVAFGERLTGRLVAGGTLVLLGTVLVALRPGESADASTLGALAVIAACTLWALDSNLTARVAHWNPVGVAMLKGALAGPVVLGLATLRAGAPVWSATAWTPGGIAHMLAVGAVGYGIGLALMVRAFRELGAARTGALFATTSLFAAISALVVLRETPTWLLAGAAALVSVGVAVVVTERRP